ncbi:hypothetical protein BV22DRAFT_1052038 [Leucogyrophana mollusca]|uniref:Uncharacterized protein n=1 Tax=Leucogyrophana mollusca TaxID=85980 RepID=A0ACB8AXH7_9AGAM|nr:hypothetical protein BV22DRAFT_1052038 [Leucogyrophana mollusca]
MNIDSDGDKGTCNTYTLEHPSTVCVETGECSSPLKPLSLWGPACQAMIVRVLAMQLIFPTPVSFQPKLGHGCPRSFHCGTALMDLHHFQCCHLALPETDIGSISFVAQLVLFSSGTYVRGGLWDESTCKMGVEEVTVLESGPGNAWGSCCRGQVQVCWPGEILHVISDSQEQVVAANECVHQENFSGEFGGVMGLPIQSNSTSIDGRAGTPCGPVAAGSYSPGCCWRECAQMEDECRWSTKMLDCARHGKRLLSSYGDASFGHWKVLGRVLPVKRQMMNPQPRGEGSPGDIMMVTHVS